MNIVDFLQAADQSITEELIKPIAYTLAAIIKYALYYLIVGILLFLLAHLVYWLSSTLHLPFTKKLKEFTELSTIYLGPFVLFIASLPLVFILVVWALIFM